jgi:hypothetical protein
MFHGNRVTFINISGLIRISQESKGKSEAICLMLFQVLLDRWYITVTVKQRLEIVVAMNYSPAYIRKYIIV